MTLDEAKELLAKQMLVSNYQQALARLEYQAQLDGQQMGLGYVSIHGRTLLTIIQILKLSDAHPSVNAGSRNLPP